MTVEGKYEAVTHEIRVSVTPQYAHDQSSPQDDRYMWHYTVKIINEGNLAVRLLTRHWRITDAKGATQEVHGDGVIGQTPTIEPGDSYTYSSGCPLDTPSGIMVGSYTMEADDRQVFDIDIPAFSLDSPHAVRTMN